MQGASAITVECGSSALQLDEHQKDAAGLSHKNGLLNGLRKQKSARKAHVFWVSGGEGGIRTHGELAPTPDFESGTFDHSATSPASCREADSSRGWTVGRWPQGRLGAETAALRGATVKVTVPPESMVPSVSSTVAVRSCLVNTNKLALPRTDEIKVQPWLW